MFFSYIDLVLYSKTKLERVIEINELNVKIPFWGLVTFHGYLREANSGSLTIHLRNDKNHHFVVLIWRMKCAPYDNIAQNISIETMHNLNQESN
jgi:hypothetical protein